MNQASKLIVGCGYLGERLARLWLAAGQRVLATTRRPIRAAELSQLGVEPVLCDVLDPATLARLPPADTVVCCVGFDRSAGVPMRQVYIDGLANLLAALPVALRFVHVSSTGVYGQSDGSVVDEDAATEPAEESGRVVLAAEELLHQRRPDAIVLRFAGIYGPGRLPRARDLLAGATLATDPDKWLNLIHVEDGARAVVAACECGQPGRRYNVSDDRPARRREFYDRLAQRLGAAPPRFVAPADDRVNRRIANGRLRRELGVDLLYPTFEEGLAALP